MGNCGYGQFITLCVCQSFLLMLFPCSHMESLPQDTVLDNFLPYGPFPQDAVLKELVKCGSFSMRWSPSGSAPGPPQVTGYAWKPAPTQSSLCGLQLQHGLPAGSSFLQGIPTCSAMRVTDGLSFAQWQVCLGAVWNWPCVTWSSSWCLFTETTSSAHPPPNLFNTKGRHFLSPWNNLMGLISSGLIAMVQMLSAAKERGFFCTEILKPSYANPCPNTSVLANCHLSCCCRLTGLLLSRETDGKGSEKRWPGENRCLLPSTALWMTPLMSSIVSLKNQHQTTHDIYSQTSQAHLWTLRATWEKN